MSGSQNEGPRLCRGIVTFLIGKNGTGKTTVINLVAAALTADFERLDKIIFKKIKITLKEKKGPKKPSIEVTKTPKKNIPYFDIAYSIKRSASEKPIIFDLDSLENEQFLRGYPPRMLREKYFKNKFLYIKKELEEIVQVSWLSVSRETEVESGISEDRKNLSAIDQKLINMNNSLVRYFSRLASEFSEETKNFQKESFISLVSIQTESDIRDFVQKVQIDDEKNH